MFIDSLVLSYVVVGVVVFLLHAFCVCLYCCVLAVLVPDACGICCLLLVHRPCLLQVDVAMCCLLLVHWLFLSQMSATFVACC